MSSPLWGYQQGAPKSQILTANISKTLKIAALHVKWDVTLAQRELSKNV